MFWLSLTGAALASPILFTSPGERATSARQEAYFEQTNDGFNLSMLTTYEGNASSVGWIVVVPGAVVSASLGDMATFKQLRQATNVRVVDTVGDEAGGCKGCGKGAGDSGGTDDPWDEGAPLDELTGSAFRGDHSIVDLGGDGTAEALGWISDNGWESSDFSLALQAYAQIGGYSFVGVRLDPNAAQTPVGGQSTIPLFIETTADQMIWPALPTYYGTAESQRSTIWFRGQQQANLSDGWTQVQVGTLQGVPDVDPVDTWEDELRDIGGANPAFALSHSGEWADGGWMSRFDSLVQAEAHSTDPTWEFAGEHGEAQARIVIEDPGSAGWLILPLGVLGGALRRRR